jgi:hypothetical protein
MMPPWKSDDPQQVQLDLLQEQIVLLRVQIENQSSALAAVAKHSATQEIERITQGRLLTPDQVRWLSEQIDMARDRKKMRIELLTHILKMGGAGGIGFIAWAIWKEIVLKIKGSG